jgi:hypothetical protein
MNLRYVRYMQTEIFHLYILPLILVQSHPVDGIYYGLEMINKERFQKNKRFCSASDGIGQSSMVE